MSRSTHLPARPQLGGHRRCVSADEEHQQQAAGEPGGPHLLPHPQLGSQAAGGPLPGARNMKQAERCVFMCCCPGH